MKVQYIHGNGLLVGSLQTWGILTPFLYENAKKYCDVSDRNKTWDLEILTATKSELNPNKTEACLGPAPFFLLHILCIKSLFIIPCECCSSVFLN